MSTTSECAALFSRRRAFSELSGRSWGTAGRPWRRRAAQLRCSRAPSPSHTPRMRCGCSTCRPGRSRCAVVLHRARCWAGCWLRRCWRHTRRRRWRRRAPHALCRRPSGAQPELLPLLRKAHGVGPALAVLTRSWRGAAPWRRGSSQRCCSLARAAGAPRRCARRVATPRMARHPPAGARRARPTSRRRGRARHLACHAPTAESAGPARRSAATRFPPPRGR